MATFPLAVRNAQLDQHNAEVLAEFARETGEGLTFGGATAAGDERKLRGIPAIGRGVAGAIPDTNPLAAVLAKESVRRAA